MVSEAKKNMWYMVLAQNMCKIFYVVPALRERDEIFYTFSGACGDISHIKVLFIYSTNLEAGANKCEKISFK